MSKTTFVIRSFDKNIKTFFSTDFKKFWTELTGTEAIDGTQYAKDTVNSKLKTEIQKAHFVLCDITKESANVTYELAYAEGLKKPIIVLRNIKEKQQEVTNTKGFDCIEYNPDDLEELQNELRKNYEKAKKDIFKKRNN